MAENSKKLQIKVLSGRNLIAKNPGNKSDPYCEITILDESGNKIGKAQFTKMIKSSLTPTWDEKLEFAVPSNFRGMKLRCWDKHKFRSDKFMGQVTVKFNMEKLNGAETIDEWFGLQTRKSSEPVSGDIHLQIHYGDDKDGVDKSRKDRSVTLSEQSTVDLNVSPKFVAPETNRKLENSTHVIVPENNEDSTDEVEDKIRDGPSATSLDRLTKDYKDLAFSNKNYEAANNSTVSNMEWAKGNVSVNGGKWSFEVRLQATSQLHIGWASSSFNPKASVGDSWTYEISSQQKFRKAQTSERYGEYCASGDIISCALNVEARTIQFWRNGKDLGVAFQDINTSSRLIPVFGFGRRSKAQVNFGKETFAYPQQGFNGLHLFLSEKEIEDLKKIFNKFRDIGNNGLEEGEERKEAIHGQGLLDFQKAITGNNDDDDPILLILAWKLNCEHVWEISQEEFITGFTLFACSSTSQIASKVKEFREEVKGSQFRNFYNFVFDYLKEERKILLLEEALVAWNLVFKDKPKWGLWDKFEEFLKAEEKKAISKDAWQQLWHFMTTYPKDLQSYDPDSSWPLIFDEFVEWTQEKSK